ncbi:MAG: hypothetical protein HN366_11105 [Deltaproteobacteria bacterium]|nr:hypothetical protein [Deltaproteobacteria bacterium]
MAVSWNFPGKLVRIEAPCLDCGEPMVVEMRDGETLKIEPERLVGYMSVPTWKWHEDWAYS